MPFRLSRGPPVTYRPHAAAQPSKCGGRRSRDRTVVTSMLTTTAVVTETVTPAVTVTSTWMPTPSPDAFPKGYPKKVASRPLPSHMAATSQTKASPRLSLSPQGFGQRFRRKRRSWRPPPKVPASASAPPWRPARPPRPTSLTGPTRPSTPSSPSGTPAGDAGTTAAQPVIAHRRPRAARPRVPSRAPRGREPSPCPPADPRFSPPVMLKQHGLREIREAISEHLPSVLARTGAGDDQTA